MAVFNSPPILVFDAELAISLLLVAPSAMLTL